MYTSSEMSIIPRRGFCVASWNWLASKFSSRHRRGVVRISGGYSATLGGKVSIAFGPFPGGHDKPGVGHGKTQDGHDFLEILVVTGRGGGGAISSEGRFLAWHADGVAPLAKR
jgi:hypothetical protein